MSVLSFTDPSQSYSVDVEKNTCTCLHWKYQRLPVNQRTCKHLESVRGKRWSASPQYVRYPSKACHDNVFQLIADVPPARFSPAAYVWSEKYDGIRVRLNGPTATTRGGISIDLSALDLPFVSNEHEFDGELICPRRPGHFSVMRELNANNVANLTVKVFDVIDDTRPFHERLRVLRQTVREDYRVSYADIPPLEELQRHLRDILAGGGEGIVVRRRDAAYGHGERRRNVAFKGKRLARLPVY